MPTPDKAGRAREIFHQVVGAPEGDRARILDELCGGDHALREQIERLLHPEIVRMVEHLDTGELIADHGDGNARDFPRGTEPYRLLRKIGEGGMADVYLAEQTEPVARRVALKVIKLGLNAGHVLARFEQERRALSIMDHPNVARVFDAGTARDGRPFFVLEHVDGHSICEFSDRSRLTIPERLSLFLEVCDAVQHAHQKGVIHRDIKPNNVLVARNEDGVRTKVIDFGIAKAIDTAPDDDRRLTAAGQFIGTPEYMSPEQAGPVGGDDIDTRTDIYSLGVLLHEMLVGALPFDSEALRASPIGEMQRTIREVEPMRPSRKLLSLGESAHRVAGNRRTHTTTLQRLLRGDLDWIILKAMDKSRSRRYASVSDLSSDIRRHLEHEPVAARRPTTRYRLSKFVRRNRGGVLAAGVVATALLVATVVSIFFGVSEARQQRVVSAVSNRLHAVVGFQQSLLSDVDANAMGATIVDSLRASIRAGWIERGLNGDELEEAIARFEEIIRVANRADVAHDVFHEEILARASRAIERDYNDDPLIEASLRHTIGRTYLALSQLERARPEIDRALAIWTAELGAGHEDTLDARYSRAWLHQIAGEIDQSLPQLNAVLEAQQRLLGSEHPKTLATLHRRARNLYLGNRHHEAAADLRLALRGQRKIIGDQHPETLASVHALGEILVEIGDEDEGRVLLAEALEGRRTQLGPDHVATLATLHAVGSTNARAGDFETGIVMLGEALDGRRRRLGEDHTATAATRVQLGSVLIRAGRAAEARDLILPVVARDEQSHEDGSPLGCRAGLLLGLAQAGLGEMANAESTLRKYLAMAREVLPEDSALTLDAIGCLAGPLRSMGKLDEAEALLRECITAHRKSLQPDHQTLVTRIVELADVLRDQGKYEDAVPLYRESADTLRRTLGPDHARTIWASEGLSIGLWAIGQRVEAVDLIKGVVSGRRRVMGDRHPQVVMGLSNLATMQLGIGRESDAEVNFREALASATSLLGPDHPEVLNIGIGLGRTLTALGRYNEAREILEGSLAAIRRTQGMPFKRLMYAEQSWTDLLAATGRLDEAVSQQRRIASLHAETIGVDHPVTLTTAARLATLLLELGDTETAIERLRDVSSRQREVLGAQHPQTLISMQSLARALSQEGDFAAALSTASTVYDGLLEANGPDHPATIEARQEIGVIYRLMGEHETALDVLGKVLDARRCLGGDQDAQTLNTINIIVDALLAVGDREAALTLAGEAASSSRETLVECHPIRVWASIGLGRALCAAARFDEAADVLADASGCSAGLTKALQAALSSALAELHTGRGEE